MMFSSAWKLLKDTVMAFIDDEALSRGAAIAFYTVTSIAATPAEGLVVDERHHGVLEQLPN